MAIRPRLAVELSTAGNGKSGQRPPAILLVRRDGLIERGQAHAVPWENGIREPTAQHAKTLHTHYQKRWRRELVGHYMRDLDRHFAQTTGITNRGPQHHDQFETYLQTADFTDLPGIAPARARIPHPPWEPTFDTGWAQADEQRWPAHLVKLHRST